MLVLFYSMVERLCFSFSFLWFLDLNWFNKASSYGFCETFANGLVFNLDNKQVIGALAGFCFSCPWFWFTVCRLWLL